MNFKLILKTLFVIVVLALLVVLGRSNPNSVTLKMPLLSHNFSFSMEAGYMYYGFFALGFLCGTVLMSGGKKGGSGSSKSSKVQT